MSKISIRNRYYAAISPKEKINKTYSVIPITSFADGKSAAVASNSDSYWFYDDRLFSFIFKSEISTKKINVHSNKKGKYYKDSSGKYVFGRFQYYVSDINKIKNNPSSGCLYSSKPSILSYLFSINRCMVHSGIIEDG